MFRANKKKTNIYLLFVIQKTKQIILAQVIKINSLINKFVMLCDLYLIIDLLQA